MRFGHFSDLHATKKIQRIQKEYIQSIEETVDLMINHFTKNKVEFLTCGGDFFDSPNIEGWALPHFLRILTKLNTFSVSTLTPVYFDLGNHEKYDSDTNILMILQLFTGLAGITQPTSLQQGVFMLPYGYHPKDYKDEIKGRVVITHHDIYGSSLAAGRSVAKFGLDHKLFEESIAVLNGHVHTRSQFANIYNVGSVVSTAQGELRNGEFPQFYEVDVDGTNVKVTGVDNKKSVQFITAKPSNLQSTLRYYAGCKLALRYEYQDDGDLDILETLTAGKDNILIIDTRRVLDSTNVTTSGQVAVKSAIDIPSILTEQVLKDPGLDDSHKDDYIKVGKDLLEKGRR